MSSITDLRSVIDSEHKKGVTAMQKTSSADKAKMIFLLLYFLILTIERVISLVSVFTGDFASYDGLDRYMTGLTVLSIIGAYAFIILKCRITVRKYPNGKVSASPTAEEGEFGKLAIAAGILLLGGVVHTHGTIPPIQFVSYGMILISMAIHTATMVKAHGNGLLRWLSFCYIVAFSMAIPVVYPTAIELSWLFIPVEIIVSAGMVIIFTVTLYNFYNGTGIYNFPVIPFLIALMGDSAVLALRWNEEINFFVLIFISVTTVLYIAGSLTARKSK